MTDRFVPRCELQGNEIEGNWLMLKKDITDLVEYRVSSTQQVWYRDIYGNCLNIVNQFEPQEPQDINYLPQGILAEVFFMYACNINGLKCIPSYGDEDIWGADFKLVNGETRYLDVTMNTSSKSFVRKTKEGTFPTIFLPWSVSENVSYAQQYLSCGNFNGREFLVRTLESNKEILHCLKKNYWRGEEEIRKILGITYKDFSGSGIQYLNHLEGVLRLIRKVL